MQHFKCQKSTKKIATHTHVSITEIKYIVDSCFKAPDIFKEPITTDVKPHSLLCSLSKGKDCS